MCAPPHLLPTCTSFLTRSPPRFPGEYHGLVLLSANVACDADEDVVPERLPGWAYPSDHVALLAELLLPLEEQ